MIPISIFGRHPHGRFGTRRFGTRRFGTRRCALGPEGLRFWKFWINDCACRRTHAAFSELRRSHTPPQHICAQEGKRMPHLHIVRVGLKRDIEGGRLRLQHWLDRVTDRATETSGNKLGKSAAD